MPATLTTTADPLAPGDRRLSIDYPFHLWTCEQARQLVGRPAPTTWLIGTGWVVASARVVDGAQAVLVVVRRDYRPVVRYVPLANAPGGYGAAVLAAVLFVLLVLAVVALNA